MAKECSCRNPEQCRGAGTGYYCKKAQWRKLDREIRSLEAREE